jgi:LPXTG-motif cell wall-anchored protein
MAKLARPRDLLCIIAQPRHGDDVAVWAMQHARELQDTDSFDAFLVSPLEYALGLKQLTTGAAEAKTRRLNRNALAKRPTLTSLSADQKQVIFGIAGFLLLVGLALWLRKRSLIC